MPPSPRRSLPVAALHRAYLLLTRLAAEFADEFKVVRARAAVVEFLELG